MANKVGSYIAVTEGAGKKTAISASYTENSQTVYDQKVIPGEQYLPSYVANFQGVGAPAGTSSAGSYIFDLHAGASLNLRIRRIEVCQSGLATTATIQSFFLFRTTTASATGGTMTIAALDNGDSAPGASGLQLPSSKGALGACIDVKTMYLMQTVGASAPLGPPLVWDFDRPHSKPLIVPAGVGNGICLYNNGTVAGASVWATIWFDETAF